METKRALSLLHCNALEEVIRRSPNVGQRNERAKIGQTNESSEVTCVEGQMYHKHYSSLRQLSFSFVFELQLSDFHKGQAKKIHKSQILENTKFTQIQCKEKICCLGQNSCLDRKADKQQCNNRNRTNTLVATIALIFILRQIQKTILVGK